MIPNREIARAVRSALFIGAIAAAGITPAHAQDQEQDVGDTVVVTGTRLQRANVTAPTAVTTIDSEAIQMSGLNNVADILRAVPSFGVPALSSANSNFLTTASGINTLELRNLDEDRTLVLVNGRRYVSGLAGSSAVDFNTIPLALVDRIEIITGGASAIYGSDALAGVINVILKKNFEGVEFGYQFGEATEGGNIENRATVTFGGNFADGRGNAVISATYSENRGMFARERDRTKVDDIAECVLTQEPGTCQNEVAPSLSSFSEYGRFFVPSTGQSFTVSQGVGPDGTVVPWDGSFGFNRQEFRRYTVPVDRYLISALLDYEIGPRVKAFVETMFAQTRTESELEPFPHSNSDLSIAGIPVDNPFVPQAIRDAVLAAGDDSVEYFRRTNEVGNRGASARRNTYRFLAGLEGQITDDWKWSTYFSYGRMDDSQQGGGQINVPNLREALNVIELNGEYVCASEAARAEGCVPVNLFGRGSITPEAAAYIVAPTSRQQMTQQEVFGADIRGPLFQVPAGDVDFAFGVEWRRERAEDVPDVLTQAGLNAGNREPPTHGSFDVGEAFFEVEVPLLRDAPGVKELSIGGAYRYSDYSTVGSTNAYAARLSWAPIDSLRFRGQFARAVRAPNIGELFAPGGENFAPVADPCDGIDANTPGTVAERCRSIPEIMARINAVGSFDLSLAEIQGTGGFTGQGNANLDAEESDSWSFGVVFDRDVGTGGNLLVSVDYFKIKIDNLIDTIARQRAVDFCFEGETFPNEFCSFLRRDTTGPAFQLGELEEVNSVFINEGTLETEGIDVSLNWRWNLADWSERIPGAIAVRVNYTHLLDFTETKFAEADDLVGEVGFSEDEWQVATIYQTGPFNVQWEWTHIGDAVPNKTSSLFNFGVGSYNVHDVQFSFDFSKSNFLQGSPFRSARVYLGVNNVFDEDAPVILSGVPGNTTGTDTNASVYDPIGRTWYAGFNVPF